MNAHTTHTIVCIHLVALVFAVRHKRWMQTALFGTTSIHNTHARTHTPTPCAHFVQHLCAAPMRSLCAAHVHIE